MIDALSKNSTMTQIYAK